MGRLILFTQVTTKLQYQDNMVLHKDKYYRSMESN